MRTITITIDDSMGCAFDVHENGKCCDGLSWEEMLGQVAMLTVPPNLIGKGFAMRTPEEWASLRADRARTFNGLGDES